MAGTYSWISHHHCLFAPGYQNLEDTVGTGYQPVDVPAFLHRGITLAYLWYIN